jgi:hypothetical protein
MGGKIRLTRHAHSARMRQGGLTLWRMPCTSCKAVFTVVPHCGLRYRKMHPDAARDALLATHGGLSVELCAVIGVAGVSGDCSESTGLPPEDVYRKVRVRTFAPGGQHDVRSR